MTSTTTATTAAPLPTAAALEAALREALAPTQLEVIDESAAWRGIGLCMMPSKFLSHRVCTPSPSRCSESFNG